ncbi:hypothetical protein [Paenarthrobacter sp. PH39-S1]|uniref:hypothetical protein n=1 Tax=Micrococcaceae TaxID=1268 RepID=UPI0024BA1DFB|nr:hypothetical protein [Paenarthrobacter sp. PH39-S1]MDJ0355404.1 hypothetical protein [Paenarthrobacter sp. PH39-S1]
MLTQLAGVLAAATEHEEKAPLLMPWWMFGVSIFVVLLVLMFITLSFTNMGNRHTAVDESADPHRQHTNKHDHGEGEKISHS